MGVTVFFLNLIFWIFLKLTSTSLPCRCRPGGSWAGVLCLLLSSVSGPSRCLSQLPWGHVGSRQPVDVKTGQGNEKGEEGTRKVPSSQRRLCMSGSPRLWVPSPLWGGSTGDHVLSFSDLECQPFFFFLERKELGCWIRFQILRSRGELRISWVCP